ncbi:MAG TPA: hypothetical protein VMB21_09965 [Candidatus Limnocylindria bacterium]|jgi:hypothetical protein|nr:hypothetical protein [Candidatus Limnocylindria bacterium]
MSHLDQQLDRLLRNAAAAPRPAVTAAELPFPAQARALGAWRNSRAEGGDLSSLIRCFRLGFICACALAMLAIGASWHGVGSETADDMILSNARADVAMMQ